MNAETMSEIPRPLTPQEKVDNSEQAALVPGIIATHNAILELNHVENSQTGRSLDVARDEIEAHIINDALDAKWAQVELGRTNEQRVTAAIGSFINVIAWKFAQRAALGSKPVSSAESDSEATPGLHLIHDSVGSSAMVAFPPNARRRPSPDMFAALSRRGVKEENLQNLGVTKEEFHVVHDPTIDPALGGMRAIHALIVDADLGSSVVFGKPHIAHVSTGLEAIKQMTELVASTDAHDIRSVSVDSEAAAA